MNVIEIKDLTKSYKGFALDHLNLSLPQGCIMGLVGENGAGKSTTIKLILDMLKKDGGTIQLFGKDNEETICLAKEDIGVVLDEVGISECMTPVQVGHIMQHAFRNWQQTEYERYLKQFSLPTNKKFKTFSRGMKMKLGLAVALSHCPKLLILDEATSGLDPVIRDEILDIFNEFTRDSQNSVLISSHIVSDLEKICDYIAFLHQGRLLLCEEKDALKEQYGILHCTKEQLAEMDPAAILGVKENPYGAEAIVQREKAPAGITLEPVDLEQLFIFMIKGANAR